MSESYRVAVKESVFRETSFTEDAFEDEELAFESEADAQAWVETQNDRHSRPGNLVLHSAHPNDNSGVDSYLVFQPTGVWVPDSS